ncbi:aminomethyl-transferring glycine dehydrogenase subunit GcvPA [bacterium]|nr:aminomethyl-transferring glycine dehydrogenase subunit GcvPA [bacterium]
MPYIPMTDDNRREMLKTIGVADFEALLSGIPENVRFQGELDLPKPLSEYEVTKLLRSLAAKNRDTVSTICFLGGGAYDHYVPAAIDHIISRSEFYTSYTPYQPEVSQGNLQAIYEYQSMIAALTGMDVANASMYDGGSALAEAALLAHSKTKKAEILISKTVHPHYRQVVRTYCHRSGITVMEIPAREGVTDLNELKKMAGDNTAGVLIQHPNFFGNLEEVGEIEAVVHGTKGLFAVSVDPVSLGVLQPPGAYNADIATGEGQAFGNALNLGGPYVGIFTATEKLMRSMPGRIAGVTVDRKGERGFVLTLQTREQHIRREKATSSICTNQQLCALASTVYLALMGKEGVKIVAEQSLQKAHYLAEQLIAVPGVEMLFDKPFFKEFAVSVPGKPEEVLAGLRDSGIYGGIDLGRFDFGIDNGILVAVTEKRTKEEMDLYAATLKKILK